AHAYKFDDNTSTFIVETPEAVWKAHGLDAMSQEEGIDFCEKLFARYLDGNALMNNATHVRGSAIWIRFPRVVCERWVHWPTVPGRSDGPPLARPAPSEGSEPHAVGSVGAPIVLMGDAAHTAHFSIGSGTKLALEDAIELTKCFAQTPEPAKALETYEALRSVEVLKIQNAARNSTEWFENVDRYSGLDAEQFFYSLLTRSQRISHENLRVRDASWLQGYEQWLAKEAPTLFTSCNALPPGGAAAPAVRQSRSRGPGLKEEAPSEGGTRQAGDERASVANVRADPPPPMLLPLKVRELTLKNRIVVSPMATYSAIDGLPQDFHLVHLGARALGGAAMVFAEMTAPCPEGRITPGCPGLWNEAQMLAWKRIVDFAHRSGEGVAMGMQLGHSGPKGSTQVGWESPDEPLPSGNWPLLAASAVSYGPTNAVPAAMTRDDMDRIKAQFVQSAVYATQAGFDWLELHCAHGYLLSSFITPLTNLRTDDYGGSLENRCRYPLEVFAAVRAAWPAQLPMSVRISAHDWAPG
ncbi:MAG: bifunctional salicylyl-CoA 5-hydroxylase/oxidoreductase, partial [Polaromonas sp.]|nr:bifunctional salicylyl-CoA 5-hydroxylase/oxidoreductase [Polaromonas sp.]